MKKAVVIADSHADPRYHNERASLIGKLIADEKPDIVIHVGDLAEMNSLCSYDKNTRKAFERSYAKDVEAACEFQDRMWHEVKKRKRKMPRRVILEGNHEERIERALDANPEMQGWLSFKDLQYDRYWDDVVRYDGGTPGVFVDSGVHYSHYFASGSMGRPIGGEHHAHSLITKKFVSCTVGHDHRLDYCIRTRADGSRIMGLSAGASMDWRSDWAGQASDSWWNGVVIKRNLEDGTYDPEFVSMQQLKNEYSTK